MLMGMPAICAMIILVVIFFFMHYMFANLTAHTTAVLPVMLASAAAIPGLHLKVFAMILIPSVSWGLLHPMPPVRHRYTTEADLSVAVTSGFSDSCSGPFFSFFLLLTCVPFLLMIEA